MKKVDQKPSANPRNIIYPEYFYPKYAFVNVDININITNKSCVLAEIENL